MAAMLNQEHMAIAYAASKNSKFIKKTGIGIDRCLFSYEVS